MLFNFKLFSKVLYAFSLLLAVILFGTIGFMLVEDYSLLNAFYMTIITVSTVGFNEVEPLSDGGRLFTAVLILTTFGTFVYAISAITSYLVNGDYKKYFKEYRVMKAVENLNNHIIVCGFGRVGRQACRQLAAYREQFVVLEKDENLVNSAREEFDFLIFEGDASDDESLRRVGIEKASALITALPSDADNLFIVLSARAMNKSITIISRASERNTVKKLRMAGANNVIMPDKVGGAHMASLVVTPDVIEFLDLISISGENVVNLEEITFNELTSDLQHKSIKELNARNLTGCNIIGFRTPAGEYIINPPADTIVVPKSKLFVLGNPKQIAELNKILGI